MKKSTQQIVVIKSNHIDFNTKDWPHWTLVDTDLNGISLIKDGHGHIFEIKTEFLIKLEAN